MAETSSNNQSGTEDQARADVGMRSNGSLTIIGLLAVVILALPLILIFCVLAAIVPFVSWWSGIFVGLVVAVVLTWFRARNAHDTVLNKIDAGVSSSLGALRAENLLQGLSLVNGTPQPELKVIVDAGANAMALRRGEQSTVLLTTGLLDRAEVIHLEAIVANLLARLRNGDAEAATVGAALLGLPVLGSPLEPLIGRVARFGMEQAVSPDSDLSADRQAVSLTRFPPGLLEALQLVRSGRALEGKLQPGLDHLWIAATDQKAASESSSRSTLDLRIDALAEL